MERQRVSWCFTSSRPVQLYQGEKRETETERDWDTDRQTGRDRKKQTDGNPRQVPPWLDPAPTERETRGVRASGCTKLGLPSERHLTTRQVNRSKTQASTPPGRPLSISPTLTPPAWTEKHSSVTLPVIPVPTRRGGWWWSCMRLVHWDFSIHCGILETSVARIKARSSPRLCFFLFLFVFLSFFKPVKELWGSTSVRNNVIIRSQV